MNLLTLASNPGEITCRGAGNDRDSVIDLTWYNEASVQATMFTDLSIDWAGSLGSDHAMPHVLARHGKPQPHKNTGKPFKPTSAFS
jgi:hypothetical protein